ncbi:hypothetical protein [Telluribacter sp. SYSU D00476]|uniref:hypothetical protein n=1 Tax=Telluribacter sp. SYSU D00476 TaxID=2811430 RepID=UPI001FF4795C|nr:hypothetical protein [Telluribacter sp. SYSU D00476]
MESPMIPESSLWMAYGITNLVALLLLAGSQWFPNLTRFLFFLLFAGAAYFNTRTALESPWVYYDYADYTFLSIYKWFIEEPFSQFTVPIIVSIAAGQVAIALAMLLKGSWFRWGCVGGIAFCLGIAPLGFGSAFPSTLLMAASFYLLYQRRSHQYLWQYLARYSSRATTPDMQTADHS